MHFYQSEHTETFITFSKFKHTTQREVYNTSIGANPSNNSLMKILRMSKERNLKRRQSIWSAMWCGLYTLQWLLIRGSYNCHGPFAFFFSLIHQYSNSIDFVKCWAMEKLAAPRRGRALVMATFLFIICICAAHTTAIGMQLPAQCLDAIRLTAMELSTLRGIVTCEYFSYITYWVLGEFPWTSRRVWLLLASENFSVILIEND